MTAVYQRYRSFRSTPLQQPATGHYTATNTGPNTRINRADIATALVDQLDDTTYSRTAISVTNQEPTEVPSVHTGERP